MDKAILSSIQRCQHKIIVYNSPIKIDDNHFVCLFILSYCMNLFEESTHIYVKEDNLIVACRVSNELKNRKIMDMISF